MSEALGGLDFEEGEDYQLSDKVSGSNLSERMQNMSVKNRKRVQEMIEDKIIERMGGDEAVTEFFDDTELTDRIDEFMRGGIRMTDENFSNLREDIPEFQDDEFVGSLIKELYKEIGNSELADRMSDAFDRKQQDSKVIRAANRIRKSKGQKPIEVTNRNVIPPKNMDFDHDD